METVIYAKALNAINGIIKATLLFQKKFFDHLKTIISDLNPYCPCVEK